MPPSTSPDPAEPAQEDLPFWQPHDLSIRLDLSGLDYTLTCPVADDSTAACHTWRSFDEDFLERDGEDGEEPEVREIVHNEAECIAKAWFDYDTRAAVEDGYQGPTRDSLVSGPIRVIACGEDEWLWEYA